MEEREITKFQETTYWKLHNIFISLNELSKHSKDDKVKKKMDDLLNILLRVYSSEFTEIKQYD